METDELVENPLLFQDETTWEYKLRREMQEIIPGLYLGPYASVMKCKRQYLIDIGITHIVCVRRSDESGVIRENFTDICAYKTIDLNGNDYLQVMIPLFKQVNAFIDSAFQQNGKILVHGNNGCLYSPTFVIAYIIARTDMNAEEALRYVMKRRFCVFPPKSMMTQLANYEVMARIPSENEIEMRNTVKRKIAEFEAENDKDDKRTFTE